MAQLWRCFAIGSRAVVVGTGRIGTSASPGAEYIEGCTVCLPRYTERGVDMEWRCTPESIQTGGGHGSAICTRTHEVAIGPRSGSWSGVARRGYQTSSRGRNQPPANRRPGAIASPCSMSQPLYKQRYAKTKILGIHFFHLSPYQTMP